MEGGQNCRSGAFFLPDLCLKAAIGKKGLFEIQTYTYLFCLEEILYMINIYQGKKEIDEEEE